MKKAILFIAALVSALSLNAQTVYVPGGTGGIGTSSNGNVGVGISTPLAKLHVNSGANSTYASILATSDEGNSLVVSSLSTHPTYTKVFSLTHEYFNSSSCRNNGAINFYRGGSERGGFLSFDTDGQERLRIDEWGKLGIGTTSPDQMLTVKGKIHAEEVIVDLNVPLADYVFARDYELMPLHQVEQYVQENSRLPEMPSAAEVKEKGMGMGEMQNKMLQKIEELTLYVIQQDKRIKALEEENQRLKGK